VCDINECFEIVGGNVGMTKGGTGDVLSGLVASFYCKNDALLSAVAAAFINKKAAESLEKKMGTFFNATDLANEIPQILKNLL
ncbi:MAG: NAD(P)H-hydrate dehydratase, partial [Patescibacteria group bacterium]